MGDDVKDNSTGKDKDFYSRGKQAFDSIKQTALEQQAEPVAKVTSETGNPDITMSWWHEPALPVGTKLYTAPPKREWVGLTTEEVKHLYPYGRSVWGRETFEAIEKALKAKNHG